MALVGSIFSLAAIIFKLVRQMALQLHQCHEGDDSYVLVSLI